jgi:hypothetical protein
MPRTVLATPSAILAEPRIIIGDNIVRNGDMEIVPVGTTATTAGKRWIDGTAGGSTTNFATRWGTGLVASGSSVFFDNAESHSGSYSLHLKLTGTNQLAEAWSIGLYDTPASQRQHAYPLHTGDYYNDFELSYWVKTNIVSGAGPGASAGLFMWSGNGAGAGGNLNPITVNTTQGWTEYRTQFSLQNAGTRFLIVKLSMAQQRRCNFNRGCLV